MHSSYRAQKKYRTKNVKEKYLRVFFSAPQRLRGEKLLVLEKSAR
jgi:hypothetical protein